jgi:malonyl-CoA O-methyltransferase
MSTIDKTFVKKSFNRHAHTYDQYAVLQDSQSRVLLQLLNGSAPSEILDIGMGTGTMTARLAEKYPAAHIHGCDIALNMLACARAKKSLTLDNNLFIAADTEFLPYRESSFDLALAGFALQWVVDAARAFREVRRVLKPGGVFLCSIFGGDTFAELRQCYEQACHETGYCAGEALFLDWSEQKVLALFHGAGFMGYCASTTVVREVYGSVAELMRAIKGMGAQNASLRRNRGLGLRAVWKRMCATYEQRFALPSVGIPATYQIIMAKGQKPAADEGL